MRRRPAEVALIRHGHKIAQVLELEVHGHLYTKSIRIIKSIDWNDSRSGGNMAPIPRGSLVSRHIQGVLSMSGVGHRFPKFELTGVVSNDVANAFQSFSHESFPGKW